MLALEWRISRLNFCSKRSNSNAQLIIFLARVRFRWWSRGWTKIEDVLFSVKFWFSHILRVASGPIAINSIGTKKEIVTIKSEIESIPQSRRNGNDKNTSDTNNDNEYSRHEQRRSSWLYNSTQRYPAKWNHGGSISSRTTKTPTD